MNDHPIVLKQRVETISIFGDEIGLKFKDGIIHRIAKEDERGASEFDMDPGNYDAEDHGGKKSLNKSKYDHEWSFPCPLRLNQDQS